MIIRGHIEVARFRGVVRRLFRNVICSLIIIEVPVAREYFAENRIERLLDASGENMLAIRTLKRLMISARGGGVTHGGRICHPLR